MNEKIRKKMKVQPVSAKECKVTVMDANRDDAGKHF